MWGGYSYHKKIRQRVLDFPLGSVFVLNDFADLADVDTVSKTLARLVDAGLLSRVMRGVFWRPDRMHADPLPDDVAKALARSNTWRVVPSGDTALHLAGLSEESPDVWTYVTDGTPREYSYGKGLRISFKRTTGRVMGMISDKTAVLVQILKAYGKEHITDELLKTLRRTFGPFDEEQLSAESHRVPAWIGHALRRLAALPHPHLTGHLSGRLSGHVKKAAPVTTAEGRDEEN